jgi:hypothetical protein
MTGIVTLPENAKVSQKFWLRKDGVAYRVTDHIQAAQYAKADSDEYERPLPWGYDDMFRHGWVRVDIENRNGLEIWADCGSAPNYKQRTWINDAKAFIEKDRGESVRLSTGRRLSGKALDDSLTPGRKRFIEALTGSTDET